MLSECPLFERWLTVTLIRSGIQLCDAAGQPGGQEYLDIGDLESEDGLPVLQKLSVRKAPESVENNSTLGNYPMDNSIMDKKITQPASSPGMGSYYRIFPDRPKSPRPSR